jgi:hypothetical protein
VLDLVWVDFQQVLLLLEEEPFVMVLDSQLLSVQVASIT